MKTASELLLEELFRLLSMRAKIDRDVDDVKNALKARHKENLRELRPQKECQRCGLDLDICKGECF